MPLKSRPPETLELNMTPMIDVLFLLIIFFMAGSKFTDDVRDIDLRLPSVSQSPNPTSTPRSLLIEVAREGQLRINDEDISREALAERLKQAPTGSSVSIHSDAGTAFQHIADVMATCKASGIRDLAVTVRVADRRDLAPP